MQNSTGQFRTGTGDVSLNGNVVIADGKTFTQGGTGTFSTGTGDVSLRGNVVIADGKTFTQGGTGTFTTATGDVQLRGNVTIATNKNFTQGGTGTFSTGTGLVQLNGNTELAESKILSIKTSAGGQGNAEISSHSLLLARDASGSANIGISSSTDYDNVSLQITPKGIATIWLNGNTGIAESKSLGFQGTVPSVTQDAGSGSGRTQGVSQNGIFGQIVTSSNALSELSAGVSSATFFTLTNTSIGANDMIMISHSQTNVYYVNAYVTASNTARISIRNITTASQTAAITIRYFVLKFNV